MLYVVAALLALILGILLYHFVFKSKNTDAQPYKVSDKDKDTLQIKEKYMYQVELKVLDVLNSIQPKKYIALPKVCLGSMLLPKGAKNVYNLLASKTLDYVVFEKQTMKPVLVVDIYDNTFNDEALAEQDPNLTKVLSDLKLPVISILIKNTFDEGTFKEQIQKLLPIDDPTPKDAKV